jgi:hypothetical protein
MAHREVEPFTSQNNTLTLKEIVMTRKDYIALARAFDLVRPYSEHALSAQETWKRLMVMWPMCWPWTTPNSTTLGSSLHAKGGSNHGPS